MEAIGIMITYTYNIYIYISYLEKSRHPSNWLPSLRDQKRFKAAKNDVKLSKPTQNQNVYIYIYIKYVLNANSFSSHNFRSGKDNGIYFTM